MDTEEYRSFPKPVSVKKKRKGVRKVGKIGKINMEANKRLHILFQSKGITSCELRLEKCWGINGMSFAHRHKRNWYKGKLDLLGEFKQVLLACIPCHEVIEKDAKLTEKVFLKLRGPDNL